MNGTWGTLGLVAGLAAASAVAARGSANAAPLTLYHGAQRWDGPPTIMEHRKGHAEHGPGIYLTTSWETARKYAKGGGSVYRMTIDGNLGWLEDARITLDEAVAWVSSTPGLRKKKAILESLKTFVERTGNANLPASVLVNAFVNNDVASGQAGPALAAFLVEHGIDASHVRNGMDDWVVLFNPKKLRQVERLTPKDMDARGFAFELPRVVRGSRAVKGSVVEELVDDMTIRIDDHGAPIAFLYNGAKQVGHAQISLVNSVKELDPYECRDDVISLKKRVSIDSKPHATLWVMWRSGIDAAHQGKGYGVKLYEAALRYAHEKYAVPAIMFPEACMEDGSTTDEAERVWASLAKRWVHEGRAISSVPKPTGTPNVGIIDFSKANDWHDIFYQEPTSERVRALEKFLRTNPDRVIRLYHGTSAATPVDAKGLLPTSASRRRSLQSASGFVYLSVYPGMARTFGEMAYPGAKIQVWEVDLPVHSLLPDLDQLRNQRTWNPDRHGIGNTLAESLAYGHGARIKGAIPRQELKPL